MKWLNGYIVESITVFSHVSTVTLNLEQSNSHVYISTVHLCGLHHFTSTLFILCSRPYIRILIWIDSHTVFRGHNKIYFEKINDNTSFVQFVLTIYAFREGEKKSILLIDFNICWMNGFRSHEVMLQFYISNTALLYEIMTAEIAFNSNYQKENLESIQFLCISTLFWMKTIKSTVELRSRWQIIWPTERPVRLKIYAESKVLKFPFVAIKNYYAT